MQLLATPALKSHFRTVTVPTSPHDEPDLQEIVIPFFTPVPPLVIMSVVEPAAYATKFIKGA